MNAPMLKLHEYVDELERVLDWIAANEEQVVAAGGELPPELWEMPEQDGPRLSAAGGIPQAIPADPVGAGRQGARGDTHGEGPDPEEHAPLDPVRVRRDPRAVPPGDGGTGYRCRVRSAEGVGASS